jgi:hypothetical protein
MLPKILLTVLLTCSLANSCYATPCAKGTQTHLGYQMVNIPSVTRHDESIGQSQFTLLSNTDNRILLDNTYEGRWFCLGFNKNTQTYLVGGIFQIGAWLPLRSIQYLRENKNAFETSAFDRLGYLANAVILSPKGRYIAFIGGQQTTGKLYVLDTHTDKIKLLGDAPAPPPLADDNFSSEEAFEWGTGWADGYVEIEPNILSFKSEHRLQVSYGKDTSHHRAKKRRLRIFDLR